MCEEIEHIATSFCSPFIKLFPAMLLVWIDGSGDNLVATLTIDQTSIRLEIPHNTTGYYKAPQAYHKASTGHKQHDLQKMRFH